MINLMEGKTCQLPGELYNSGCIPFSSGGEVGCDAGSGIVDVGCCLDHLDHLDHPIREPACMGGFSRFSRFNKRMPGEERGLVGLVGRTSNAHTQ
jgi:hypothetical protein